MSLNRRKICIVLPAHWEELMGGSQYQAKMLIDHLIKAGGYDIYYLARHVNHDFKPEGYRIIQIADPSGFRKYGELFDSFKLYELLKQISPDVVYQRVGCAYTGICAYYAKKYNKKCVWHVAHDREVTPGTGKFSKTWIFGYIDKKLLEYGLRNSSQVVTQTRQQAELMSKYYRRTRDMIMPNVHPWPAEHIEKESAESRVVWVANLKPWKRPEIFMRLAKDLSDIRNVKFFMVGDLRANPEWCKSIIDESKNIENLEYMGGQTQEGVNEILSKAHIFVNTSMQEGFANTFIQSWLRKMPVLSLTVNPDGVLNDRKIGMCAENYDELRSNLRYLLENPDERVQMGENAQNYAADVHAYENMEKLSKLMFGG
jgi:glycosyltransferase involved in cell wall biosynthesis